MNRNFGNVKYHVKHPSQKSMQIYRDVHRYENVKELRVDKKYLITRIPKNIKMSLTSMKFSIFLR